MRSDLNDALERWREEQRKRQLRESEARHREMLKTHTYDPDLDIYTPRQEEDPKPGHPVPLSEGEP